MCIALRISLLWILTTIFWEIAKLSPLQVIARHLGYFASDGVASCRSRSRTFRLRNFVSIFCNSEVISTSGFAAILTLTVDTVAQRRTRSNFAVLVSSWILNLEWLCYYWNLLSYYYFRFLSAIYIFGKKRCRPLSLEVTCMRLDY